jgi:hypothetical protein
MCHKLPKQESTKLMFYIDCNYLKVIWWREVYIYRTKLTNRCRFLDKTKGYEICQSNRFKVWRVHIYLFVVYLMTFFSNVDYISSNERELSEWRKWKVFGRKQSWYNFKETISQGITEENHEKLVWITGPRTEIWPVNPVRYIQTVGITHKITTLLRNKSRK